MPTNAAALMSRHVVSAGPDDTVAAVAQLLLDHDISAAPVCDERGALLGMISETDLLRPFERRNAPRGAWWLGILARGPELAPVLVDYIRSDHRRARDLMTAPVVTATETAGLAEIATLMLRHRVKRVPILRDGKVIGIISRADLASAVACRPEAFASPARHVAPAGGGLPALTFPPLPQDVSDEPSHSMAAFGDDVGDGLAHVEHG